MKLEPSLSMPKAWLITNKGFSLVEVILASSVFALLVTAFVGAYLYGEESTALASNRSQAVLLAEEGLEAARNIRDASFANLTPGTHGILSTLNQWEFSGTSDTTDSFFTRQVVISNPTPNRKEVMSIVTWQQTPSRTGSVTLTTQFTNWIGTKKGTAPSLFGTLDLTAANSGDNNTDAISVASQGNYVYIGRSTNPGNEFFAINVTDPASPSISGQLALGGDPNDIVVSGNYAYIASSDNSAELTVVDISIPTAPTLAATFNLTAGNSGSANNDGLAVVIGKSDYVYLTRSTSGGKEFYVFNVSTPTAPSLVGLVNLNGDINEVTASGNYAYGASTDNSQELQVIDVTSVSAPALATSLDLNEGDTAANGFSVALGINTVYIGRDGSAGSPEFYTIDITTPTSPSIISSFNIGTHILRSLDYSASADLVFFANKNPASDDYATVDVSVPTSPALLTSLNLDGVPNKLVYESSSDKVYIVSGSDSQELQVVAP